MDRGDEISWSNPIGWREMPRDWFPSAVAAGYPTVACGHCGDLFQSAKDIVEAQEARDVHVIDNHPGTATALEVEGF